MTAAAQSLVDQQTERWPINDVTPDPRNSRKHPKAQIEQLRQALKVYGWTFPLLVKEDGTCLVGNGRLEAAKLEGHDTVPVIVARGWSDEQCRAYAIADNKLAANSEWNPSQLAVELSELQGAGVDMDLTGFSMEELDELLAPKPTRGHTDPNKAPAAPATPISRSGDLWQLGPHRVLCGDSSTPAAVQRLLAGDVPRLMVTDPPYGVDYDPAWRTEALNAGAGTAVGKVQNDDRADWRETWQLFPGDVAYVWHGGLHGATVQDSLRAAGFLLRAQIVWIKPRAVISRGHYHWQHEPALMVERAGDDDNAAGEIVLDHDLGAYAVRVGRTGSWRGGRRQSTVWEIEHLKSETGHGTQKPIDCMRRPMLNNSNPGALVYDPFLGSGTTLIAAEMEGRVCLGLELDPAYVDVIVRRWQDFTHQEAVCDGKSFTDLERERGALDQESINAAGTEKPTGRAKARARKPRQAKADAGA